ncbi:MAG: aminoacyl-tRNA hydrolase [Chloroflexi bacterium]|nr:aminoacyl-tRNA hydrolase [Chloroflexota bacterium]
MEIERLGNLLISQSQNSMDNRYLITGLGNPGRKYRGNRHNIGFMVVDRLAAAYGIQSSKVQNKAIVGSGRIANKPVIIAKPQTYMNRSGDAVGPLTNYYKIPNENILIIYDELDLPFGAIRLREKGGAGGHNGMRSLINHLGQEFARMRLGIGRPPGRMPVEAYVLQDFHKDNLLLLDEVLDTAVQAVETFLAEGIQLTMSRYNGSVIRNL